MRLLRRGKQSKDAFDVGIEVTGVGHGRPHLQVFHDGHGTKMRGLPAPVRSSSSGPRASAAAYVAAGKRDAASQARGLPKIVIISVDLPAPFAPISATISLRRLRRRRP